MNVRHILATATLCTLLTGAGVAQVTGQTIHNRKGRRARSVKFHKFAHDFRFAEHLRDGQREVRRRRSRLE